MALIFLLFSQKFSNLLNYYNNLGFRLELEIENNEQKLNCLQILINYNFFWFIIILIYYFSAYWLILVFLCISNPRNKLFICSLTKAPSFSSQKHNLAKTEDGWCVRKKSTLPILLRVLASLNDELEVDLGCWPVFAL